MEPIPSHQLEAFMVVAETKHFTRAASRLHLTQSALSQRILKLEELLETALLIRDPREVRITAAGERLLRYARTKQALETEAVGELLAPRQNAVGLRGNLRIGGFSTVMRSLVLPRLAPLLQANSEVKLELRIAELRELQSLLRSGEVDLVLSNELLELEGVESVKIFEEENVMIESKQLAPERTATVFDHDPDDQTTDRYLKIQSKRFRQTHGIEQINKSYLDEIYVILDAVELGLGRAVVPRHLLQGRSNLRELSGGVCAQVPVFLQRLEAAYRPKLQAQAYDLIRG